VASAVAIGMRARTGAADLIVLARGPRLLARARIALAAEGAEHCFHAAAELPLAEAERLVAAARADAAARAAEAIAPLVRAHGIARAGLVRGKGRALPPLATIQRVHAMQHAAEGEHYRDALEAACAELGLAVVGIPLPELAAAAGAVQGDLPAALAALGRAAGSPWTAEQKEAAMAGLVALTALSTTSRSSRRSRSPSSAG
jgi:hypothetical protein